eukprot:SAG22_NODE_1759_length_3637_cov_2.968061_3_plen_405_part_00
MKSSADILKQMRTQSLTPETEEPVSPNQPQGSAHSPGGGGGSKKSPSPKGKRVLTLKGVIPMNLGLDRVMTVRTGGHTPEFDALVPPGGQPGQIWHFKVETGEPGQRWNIVESIEFEDPPDPHALPGAGVVYRCVSRAVMRSGMDRMSKIVGYAERGEELVSLETRVYSGRIRVRFETGWSSITSGSGKALFKKRPGLKPWVQEEEDAKEAAKMWLEMGGHALPVVERILKLQEETGHKPTQWLETLQKMDTAAFEQYVKNAEASEQREKELATYMQEAGELLVIANYEAAARRYQDVLQVDADNEEAARGQSEAQKGERLAKMSEQDILESLQIDAAGEMLTAYGASASLHTLLGVEEGQEDSARADPEVGSRFRQLPSGALSGTGTPAPPPPPRSLAFHLVS